MAVKRFTVLDLIDIDLKEHNSSTFDASGAARVWPERSPFPT
jgi:hypothetical protein